MESLDTTVIIKSYNVLMETKLLYNYLLVELKKAKVLLAQIHSDSYPENLHQYRITLRRVQSLVSTYIKERSAFEERLKPLLKSTNILREIDVFVMGVDAVRYPLLLSDLRRYRASLYRKHWGSDIIRIQGAILEQLIDALDTLACSLSNMQLVKRGVERYDKALSLKKELGRKSSAKKIHKVRISCKQARYALEFIEASRLHRVDKQIRRCKKILRRFGDIQDTANQLEMLKEFCKTTPSDGCDALYKERKKAFKTLKKQF